jgi:hypothetical protein
MAAKTEKVDYLEEDPDIPSQRFAIVSWLTPGRILEDKQLHFFTHFRRQYVVDTRLTCFETFLAFLSKKYEVRVDDIMADFAEFKKVHEKTPELTYSDVDEAYKVFMMKHEQRLEAEFREAHAFQTDVLGVKVRKVFSSQAEAEHASKKFIALDNGIFRTSIVSVGKWLAWDPNDHLQENVESSNEQLNELARLNRENQTQAATCFKEEVELRKKKAKEDNERRKAEADRLRELEETQRGIGSSGGAAGGQSPP